jgi:type IV secretory pathway VirB6-like protein
MFSSPYSVANTKFELKNPFLITYSRWTKFILLWDIEKQVILQNLLLRGGPTTINFFHNSLILAIGHV